MPRTCTICEYPKRELIDKQLIANQPYRGIAKRFKISESALYRHKSHLSKTLKRAKEAEEISHADNLLKQVRELQNKTLNILSKSEKSNDLRTALNAIREARGNFELLAKLLGELNYNPQINILISPEWLELKSVITKALDNYPKAKKEVLKALEVITNGSTS